MSRRRALELARVYAPTGDLTADEAAVFSCPACRRPLTVLTDYACAACLEVECNGLGTLFNIADLADTYAITYGEGNPAGRPRPRREGRPLPWLTPVIGRLTFWRFVHGGRLAAAQERWWCQVCGEPCEDLAAAVVEADGRLPTAAVAHPRCAALSVALCPVMAANGARVCPVTWGNLSGLPLDRNEGPHVPLEALAAPSHEWHVDFGTMLARIGPAPLPADWVAV